MRNILFAAMAVMAFTFSAPSQAADEVKAGMKIAVVDVQSVVGSSKAGKSIQEQINKQREAFKEEFSKLEKDLSEAQKKLSEQSKDKPEEVAAKKKEFEGRLLEANKLVQQKRQSLDKAAGEASLSLRREIVKVVAELSKKGGYDIVLSSQNVIVSQENMDITDSVLKELDKSLPDMKLNMGGSAEPEKAPAKKK